MHILTALGHKCMYQLTDDGASTGPQCLGRQPAAVLPELRWHSCCCLLAALTRLQSQPDFTLWISQSRSGSVLSVLEIHSPYTGRQRLPACGRPGVTVTVALWRWGSCRRPRPARLGACLGEPALHWQDCKVGRASLNESVQASQSVSPCHTVAWSDSGSAILTAWLYYWTWKWSGLNHVQVLLER